MNKREKTNAYINSIIFVCVSIMYIYGIYLFAMGLNPNMVNDTVVGFIQHMCMGLAFVITLTTIAISFPSMIVRTIEWIINDA